MIRSIHVYLVRTVIYVYNVSKLLLRFTVCNTVSPCRIPVHTCTCIYMYGLTKLQSMRVSVKCFSVATVSYELKV